MGGAVWACVWTSMRSDHGHVCFAQCPCSNCVRSRNCLPYNFHWLWPALLWTPRARNTRVKSAGQHSLMHVLLCLCLLLSHHALALLRLPVQQGEVLHVLALFRLQGQQDQVLHALDLLQLQGQPEQVLLPSPMAPRLVSPQFAVGAMNTSRGAPYPSHDRSPIAARSRTSCARPVACRSKTLLLRPLGQ